jgi:hypothetical protein
MNAMRRLIVTNDSSAAGGLKKAARADIAIPVDRRLVWGPLPSDMRPNLQPSSKRARIKSRLIIGWTLGRRSVSRDLASRTLDFSRFARHARRLNCGSIRTRMPSCN